MPSTLFKVNVIVAINIGVNCGQKDKRGFRFVKTNRRYGRPSPRDTITTTRANTSRSAEEGCGTGGAKNHKSLTVTNLWCDSGDINLFRDLITRFSIIHLSGEGSTGHKERKADDNDKQRRSSSTYIPCGIETLNGMKWWPTSSSRSTDVAGAWRHTEVDR